MSGARDVRRNRARALVREVERRGGSVAFDELVAEMDRRGDALGMFVLALAHALDERLVLVEHDGRVVCR